jgi:hypothetical protein
MSVSQALSLSTPTFDFSLHLRLNYYSFFFHCLWLTLMLCSSLAPSLPIPQTLWLTTNHLSFQQVNMWALPPGICTWLPSSALCVCMLVSKALLRAQVGPWLWAPPHKLQDAVLTSKLESEVSSSHSQTSHYCQTLAQPKGRKGVGSQHGFLRTPSEGHRADGSCMIWLGSIVHTNTLPLSSSFFRFFFF